MKTIRNREAFLGGLWDWAVLDGCFGGTRIRPTDVDGLIERHGCFLFLEAKPPGGTLSQGQQITLRALSRQPRTCVLVIYGDPAEQTVVRITRMWQGRIEEQADPSLETFRRLVVRWFDWADKQPKPR
jgi:hypothetical protein